jgi:hypothetical protein
MMWGIYAVLSGDEHTFALFGISYGIMPFINHSQTGSSTLVFSISEFHYEYCMDDRWMQLLVQVFE